MLYAAAALAEFVEDEPVPEAGVDEAVPAVAQVTHIASSMESVLERGNVDKIVLMWGSAGWRLPGAWALQTHES